jgi:site-specific DNA-methyltransferase (cytosine-N4-specific)
MILGRAEDALTSDLVQKHKGRIQLVFTSPPFPLNHKKKYGNLQGEKYVAWLASFAQPLAELLTPDGSIVLELGNAWEPGKPVMSTLALEALLAFREAANLYLCQQFVCNNPARLPGPAQWVNVERIRVKDSFTYLWWMSPNTRPKADNRRVLKPYSTAMLQLLKSRKYSSGKRPSQHNIRPTSFLKDHKGAIPSNFLEFSNTKSGDKYQRYCRDHGLPTHPARMPSGLPEFFVRFLTEPGDLVLDPFAGSNTTGAAAEHLGRRWLSIELQAEYVAGSWGRFSSVPTK